MGDNMARAMKPWNCAHCQADQTHETWCTACERPRFASFAIQVAEHVLEHLSEGLSDPLDVLKAMQDRPCYRGTHPTRPRIALQLSFIAQQMRLLTKDTTQLARQLAKARAARTMLEVLETGDNNHKIAVLKGTQVLGEVVEHKGELVTRFVVETHDGLPPKPEDSE